MTRPRLLLLVLAAAGCSTASGDPRDALPADAPIADAAVDAAPLPPQTSRLRIVSRCAEPIWIASSDNLPGDPVRLATGELHDYDIPAAGLASARFWPKVGCDDTGHACRIGDVGQPPIDSKFEVTFAPIGSSDATFYNLSLVDGFTLPFSVTPVGDGAGTGSCIASDCTRLTVDECPAHEDLGGGAYPAYADVDLRLEDVGCMSPCKAWNYPAPYGLGQPESDEPGRHLCCPAPMSPEACRDAGDPLSVVHTEYVALVHARCPTAYSYSYDDDAGLHACPASIGFRVEFCR